MDRNYYKLNKNLRIAMTCGSFVASHDDGQFLSSRDSFNPLI